MILSTETTCNHSKPQKTSEENGHGHSTSLPRGNVWHGTTRLDVIWST